MQPYDTRGTILVAEDEAINRLYLSSLLHAKGYVAHSVDDAVAAIELFEKAPVDVILMDMRLPGMSGIEAVRTIREREQQRGGHVHIIALTAYSSSHDRARFQEAGVDDCVSKPYDEQALLDRLASVMQGSARSAERS